MNNKYQVTFSFNVDEEFMRLVPRHRMLINDFIIKGVIETYAISVEASRGWILFNAKNKGDVRNYVEQSPLFPYFFNLEIDQLMVYDSQMYRFPKMVLN